MYAIVRDRGMQYRVEEGQTLNIALLDAEPGSEIELGEVLLIGGEMPIVGTPTVDGAKVIATVLGKEKGEKIVVFRYKNKKRYRRRTGHRQEYTRISINKIVVGNDQKMTTSPEGETDGA
ncbi:MAG: 50S ribosomal protein L21 [Roseiflexus sp.]|nr:50S ribosomal protein L21 [Roseiflexus sp.]MDW8148444.1 50S ribosomal protein L21 [Roseiflexaceae bacterium]MDW8234533.1 50S ribosomal protein L21 [Roseiflexaceae bacterium]